MRLIRKRKFAQTSIKQQVKRLFDLLKYFCVLAALFVAVLGGIVALASANEATSVEDETRLQASGAAPSELSENGLGEEALNRLWSNDTSTGRGARDGARYGQGQGLYSKDYSDVSILDSLNSASGSQSITTFGGFLMSKNGFDQLQAAVDSINSNGYNVGFIVVDLTTGKGVSYNADQSFYSASAIKGPYVASLAALEPSSVAEWQWAMENTIEISDNESYEYLRYAFGPEPMSTWCSEAGVSTNIADEYYPELSTRDLAKLWLRNYNYFASDDPNSSLVQSWYTSSWNSVINENLGSLYYMNTKAGWIDPDDIEDFSAANDAGIVWAYDRPYLVVIMSDSPGDLRVLDSLVVAIDNAHTEML